MKKIVIALVASFAFFLSFASYAKDVMVCQGYADGSRFEVCFANGQDNRKGKHSISSVYREGWHLVSAFKNDEEREGKKFTFIFEE
jgi:hypothetical protein